MDLYCARTWSMALTLSMMLSMAEGVGNMGTIVALWSSTSATLAGVPSMATCVIQVFTQLVKCWSTVEYGTAFSPAEAPPMWAITAGNYFICGLDNERRRPFCWGFQSLVPQEFQNRSYMSIAAGVNHVCAVHAEGSSSLGNVDCWGSIFKPNNVHNLQMVTSGMDFSCGLDIQYQLHCWGDDITFDKTSIPIPVNIEFATISAGMRHVCGITLGHHIMICWGDNTYGQSMPPVGVPALTVSSGYDFTCALRTDTHEAFCWGNDSFGQLSAPAGIRFSSITAGDSYACGVVEAASKGYYPQQVVCWGLYKRSTSKPINACIPVDLYTIMSPCNVSCNGEYYAFFHDDLRVCLKEGYMVCLPKCINNCRPLNATILSQALAHGEAPQPTPSEAAANVSTRQLRWSFLLSSFGALMVLSCILAAWRFCFVKDSSWSMETYKILQFTCEQLQLATDGYRANKVVGQGSFGTVYRGILSNGREVAVKKASTPTHVKASTFETELKLLSRLHHRCLVNLVGYCEKDKALVFEYMANGSLNSQIFGKQSSSNLMDWASRMQVALEAARGLEYLHVYASPRVIHRDIKSANILLDHEWHAHLADFGLSVNGPSYSRSYVSHQFPMGTEGYLDPEQNFPYKLSMASDIYSFGVVLLEILSGHEVVGAGSMKVSGGHTFSSVVAWAEFIADRGDPLDILDDRIALPNPATSQALLSAIKLALNCVKVPSRLRPSVSEVVASLQGVAGTLWVHNSTAAMDHQAMVYRDPIDVKYRYNLHKSSPDGNGIMQQANQISHLCKYGSDAAGRPDHCIIEKMRDGVDDP